MNTILSISTPLRRAGRKIAAVAAMSLASLCHAEVSQCGWMTNPTKDHNLAVTIRTTVFDRINGATSTYTERVLVLKPGESVALKQETGSRQNGSEGVLWYESSTKVEAQEFAAHSDSNPH